MSQHSPHAAPSYSLVIHYMQKTQSGHVGKKAVRDLYLDGKAFSALVNEYRSLESSYRSGKIRYLYFFAVPRRLGFDAAQARSEIMERMDALEARRLECEEQMAAIEDRSSTREVRDGGLVSKMTTYPGPYGGIMHSLERRIDFNSSAQLLLARLLESINSQRKIMESYSRKGRPVGI